jgi:hypothetical protein
MMYVELLKELYENADRETDECIIWKHRLKPGYGHGQISIGNKDNYVHRLALIRRVGQPPEGKPMALHKPIICHNPSCYNYRHLYWGDAADNVRDRALDNTDNKGSRHGMSKLTESDIPKIRKDPRLQRIIAEEYGIDQSLVSRIKANIWWTHVK